MANKVIRSNMTEELKHYGVLGMKWGVRKAQYKSNSLTRKVRKTTKRFDKGKDPDTTKISKKVRRQKYKMDKAIRRADKFLAKNKKANAKDIVNRYNRDPAKKKAVEKYMKDLKIQANTLAELRMQLIDIRI